MILTYKYRIKDKSSCKTLRHYAWAVNQVWNYCVAYQRDIQARYYAGAPKRRWPLHFALVNLTSGTSKELGIHSDTVSEVCRVFVNSRSTTKHAPRFRSSGGSRRALGWVPLRGRFLKTEGNCITYYGKQFRIFEGGRPIPANFKTGCFVEDSSGRWFICFHAEVTELPHTEKQPFVGIDLGLKSIVACSDGRAISAPKVYRQYEAKLAVAQRAGNKARARAIHAKIKNCRKDFLHKLSTELVRGHDMIAVGNVNSSRLAKTRMAKSVLDAGWSTFRAMLSYKCQQAAVSYREVDEMFTTVTCSACGARSGPKGQKGLRIREWTCVECGTVHDRDCNSAKNILARSAAGPVEESRGGAEYGNRIGTRQSRGRLRSVLVRGEGDGRSRKRGLYLLHKLARRLRSATYSAAWPRVRKQRMAP